MQPAMDEKGDLAGFDAQAKEIADFLLGCKKVTVVGHIDADGITATSIAYKALQDQHIDVHYNFIKKIDENEIRRINKIGSDGAPGGPGQRYALQARPSRTVHRRPPRGGPGRSLPLQEERSGDPGRFR